MFLFDWLISKSKPAKHVAPATLAKAPTRQVTCGHDNEQALKQISELKTQRQERRDCLYAVVREAMLRSEVLASRYKFKVLSLDTHGREFLVMVDLLDAKAVSPERFSIIEQLIISHADQQHAMCVKSVYWRVNMASEAVRPVPASRVPAPPALTPLVHATAPVAAPSAPRHSSVPAHAPAFEPIDQAEVLAFKKALGATPKVQTNVSGQVRTTGPRHQQVATGYEDTQLLEQIDEAASPLSRTQFGDL